MFVRTEIRQSNIEESVQVLVDNEIDPDEAETVLQAIGYTLIDTELFEDELKTNNDLHSR